MRRILLPILSIATLFMGVKPALARAATEVKFVRVSCDRLPSGLVERIPFRVEAILNLLPYLMILVLILLIPLWVFLQNIKKRKVTIKPDPQEVVRLHIWLTGRVQNIGFRSFIQKTGAQFDVTGWVCNVREDMVETVAEGPRDQVENFAEAVKIGPRGAKVDNTLVEWETPSRDFTDFSVKYE